MSTIFVVESKNADTGKWEVVDGAGANARREYAEEEMGQYEQDNPEAAFRVAAYTRHA